MEKKYAVIDLGSNTFHLLVASYSNDKVEQLFRDRRIVSLCEQGGNTIGIEAIIRGLAACQHFKNLLDSYKPIMVRCVGTSALRTASNSDDFIREAEKILQTRISIIDGITEAQLIYKGMMSFRKLENQSHIGIDIGGGSTEFIYKRNAETSETYRSFEIGIGSLYNAFHKSDPISPEEYDALTEFIKKSIHNLAQEANNPVEYLIGAAGSFEILESIYTLKNNLQTGTDIPAHYISEMCNKIISMGREERLQIPGIPPERNKYIVVACAIILEAILIWKPKYVVASPYGLKEGVLAEMVAGGVNS